MSTDFLDVTELAGDEVTAEQVERMCHRYYWAAHHCEGKDVVEVACGTGQGLGYLAARARSLVGGDFSQAMVDRAAAHYGRRVEVRRFDAQDMPFADASLDAVLIFEALYYLPDAERFAAECRRVLRPGGKVLVANANKDLYDFNPSPYSHVYHGAAELAGLFAGHGFAVETFGHLDTAAVSPRQKLLRPVKKMAGALGLIPKTMEGKKRLKRLVFGGLVTMPAEIADGLCPYVAPIPIPADRADTRHKVIYALATLP